MLTTKIDNILKIPPIITLYVIASPNTIFAVSNATKGTEKKVQLDKNGGYILQPNEVAVYNPVKLRAVREHDLIDGAAWAIHRP